MRPPPLRGGRDARWSAGGDAGGPPRLHGSAGGDAGGPPLLHGSGGGPTLLPSALCPLPSVSWQVPQFHEHLFPVDHQAHRRGREEEAEGEGAEVALLAELADPP